MAHAKGFALPIFLLRLDYRTRIKSHRMERSLLVVTAPFNVSWGCPHGMRCCGDRFERDRMFFKKIFF